MRRGFALTEVLSGLIIITFVLMGAAALLGNATQGFANTVTDTKLSNQNAQGMRYVSEALRKSMSVTINTNSNRIVYVWPKLATNPDSTTGERELMDPTVSDGVTREFIVNWTAGTLTDAVTGRILCRNLVQQDPQVGSSQYNKNYQPFQLTSIGSAKAVTITFITQENAGIKRRYTRLKTTAMLRNYKG